MYNHIDYIVESQSSATGNQQKHQLQSQDRVMFQGRKARAEAWLGAECGFYSGKL
jgi:hypothetical protein